MTELVIHLRAAGTSLVLDARGTAVPVVIHWGADLGPLTVGDLENFADLAVPGTAPSSVDEGLRLRLVPLAADGWTGIPGLDGRHDLPVAARRPALRTADVQLAGPNRVVVTLIDDADGPAVLSLTVELELTEQGILRSGSRLVNLAEAPYEVTTLAAALPVLAPARERLDFAGAWGRERIPQRAPIDRGTWLRESRHGRGGHDDAFLTAVGTPGFSFRSGEVWASHLAWSGDKRSWIDTSSTGLAALGLGELLAPGEVRLATGEQYESPWVLSAWSPHGLDGISARFHEWFRALPAHPAGPRPLTLNTWEAVYFDQSFERLADLARIAASVGVERFVLDDGWMRGRTDDRRALGDWLVDTVTWPDGLAPLIDLVHSLGMQFGLWVEPEMVSLDSDLAREHPEWVLRESARLPLPWRHQQVLDLANDSAREHVRDALLALLDEHRIDYFKWDMNRDQLAGSAHAQVTATYRLMDELRERHPALEIESCSSGGGRIDAGILQRVQRVWPSDTNDPHDRQSIVRWTSLLVPLEYLGSHVGPAPAHVSGRSLSLSFALATALFGHAGIEWDLALATPAELEALTRWATEYRRLRPLLHTGTLVRGDDDADPVVTGIVAADRRDAVYSIVCLESATTSARPARRLPGLDPDLSYRVEPVDLGAAPSWYWGDPPAWFTGGGFVARGSVLGAAGIPLPLLHPDQAVVLRVVAL